MLKPRLKRTVDAVESAAGDIYILRPGADSDLVIERPDRRRAAAAGRARRHAHGRPSSRASSAATRVRSALGDLDRGRAARGRRRRRAHAGARPRALRPPAALLRRPRARATPASEYQRRMREARVALLGVGRARQLGRLRARLLRRRRAGARRRRRGRGEQLQPPDPLPRARHRPAQGRGRGRGAGRVQLRLPPRRRCRAGSRAWPRSARSIEGADFVVNAADWPAHDIERWTNAACVAAGLPFITMSHSPPVARVGPLYVPGATGCYACQESAYRESHPLYDELVEQRRGRPSPAPTLGPVCAFIGGQVALEALHQVTGLCPPATLGAAHIYDLRTMQVTREPCRAWPDCEVCGQLMERDQPRAARSPRALARRTPRARARDVVALRRSGSGGVRPGSFRPRANVSSSRPAKRPGDATTSRGMAPKVSSAHIPRYARLQVRGRLRVPETKGARWRWPCGRARPMRARDGAVAARAAVEALIWPAVPPLAGASLALRRERAQQPVEARSPPRPPPARRRRSPRRARCSRTRRASARRRRSATPAGRRAATPAGAATRTAAARAPPASELVAQRRRAAPAARGRAAPRRARPPAARQARCSASIAARNGKQHRLAHADAASTAPITSAIALLSVDHAKAAAATCGEYRGCAELVLRCHAPGRGRVAGALSRCYDIRSPADGTTRGGMLPARR